MVSGCGYRFEEYKLEYSLTQNGQEFLQQIEVTMPSETEEEPDETLLETQLPMSEWASALKPATTEKKRMAIGYMPGKTADAWYNNQRIFAIDESGDFYRRDSGVFES